MFTQNLEITAYLKLQSRIVLKARDVRSLTLIQMDLYL